MLLSDQNVLFFIRSKNYGGSEEVVLQLCEILYTKVNKIVVAGGAGFPSEKLNPMGIKYFEMPDIENKSPATMIKVSRMLKDIVNKEQITVIHAHNRMAAFYVYMLQLYKKSTFIVTEHSVFSNKRLLTRLSYCKAHLVACGEMVKKNMNKYFGINDVIVIHNAVKPFDGEIIDEPLIKKEKSQGRFIVGNVGRLSQEKGMEYFIDAVPMVLDRHPDTSFYIIGAGPEETKLKEAAKALPVVFLGYRKDVRSLMSQIDLMVLSSLHEGLPLTPIESFSVGKTIVATAIDGTGEIVKDGYNGLLVPARNAERLADRICWIIEHPDEKQKYENNAKMTYENEFSFTQLANSYTEFYESI